MCTSSPSIPNNKTPAAPPSPEAAPDAPQIGPRAQFLRSRGLLIPAKPDLTGLASTSLGTYVNRLLIGPDSNKITNPDAIVPSSPSVLPAPTGAMGSGGSRLPYVSAPTQRTP